MKRILYALMIVGLLLVLAAAASANGGCPDGFVIHPAMAHDGHHQPPHHHIGTSTDLNGDGQICVKHLSPSGLHVHIDNNAIG